MFGHGERHHVPLTVLEQPYSPRSRRRNQPSCCRSRLVFACGQRRPWPPLFEISGHRIHTISGATPARFSVAAAPPYDASVTQRRPFPPRTADAGHYCPDQNFSFQLQFTPNIGRLVQRHLYTWLLRADLRRFTVGQAERLCYIVQRLRQNSIPRGRFYGSALVCWVVAPEQTRQRGVSVSALRRPPPYPKADRTPQQCVHTESCSG